MIRFISLILPILGIADLTFSQDRLPEPWISYPSANNHSYGVYHFRKAMELDQVPEQLVSSTYTWITWTTGTNLLIWG